MSDIIRLLPDSVANQIAAGEVIQRPASVIKELVENSVDAGARQVTIVLRDAGRTLIQVVDDGSGMSDTDARMSFERHATSKIAKADDLFSLHTMGFRGEALASIAAIAQLDVRTMRHDQTMGTRLVINGSVVESQTPEACAPGTNMMVKNLFFNVPARRKFLKRDAVEMSNVLREFERLALVNPDVEFHLTHNDNILHTLRRGNFKQRIGELFGKTVERQLLPVSTDTSIVKIEGFVSLPEHARKRNPLQYLMVNGRNMRHPYFHKAIMQCYEGLIAPDAQPNYFIKMTVDPQTIDVNIHPTKNEIKFENEQAIWQIITAAIKESLGRFNGVPGIDFEAVDMLEIPAFEQGVSKREQGKKEAVNLAIDPTYDPFKTPAGVVSRPSALNDDGGEDWEKLYEEFSRKRNEGLQDIQTPTSQPQEMSLAMEEEFVSTGVMQLAASYVLTPVRNGVMVIDQHRAHYAVLYHRYLNLARERKLKSQGSMFPETLTLSASQNAVLASIAPELPDVGFDLREDGDGNWQVLGSPSLLEGVSATQVLMEMIETVTETGEEANVGFQDRLARVMARRAAITRGRGMTVADMDTLVSDLFKLPTPGRDPDGKRVFEIITTEYINKLLG